MVISATATVVASLLMTSLADIVASQKSDVVASDATFAFDTNSGKTTFSRLAFIV